MWYSDRPDAVPSDGGTALLAVTVASLVLLAMLLARTALSGLTPSQFFFVAPMVFVLGFPITFFVGLLVAGFIGLPLTYLLANLGWERPWVYPLAGGIVGAAVAVLMFGTADPFAPVFLGAFPGLAAGFVWWRYNRRYLQEIGDLRG